MHCTQDALCEEQIYHNQKHNPGINQNVSSDADRDSAVRRPYEAHRAGGDA